jgi:endonuclease-3 related protein
VPRFTESIPDILSNLAGMSGRVGADSSPGADVGSFLAVAGAYLSRSGEARPVFAAIVTLRESGWSDPHRLASADQTEIHDAFQQGGARSLARFASPLLKLARWYAATFDVDGDTTSIATESIRDDLRSINGIGPATADAILLHGFGRSAYPVDHATYRILVRHGWIDEGAEYDDVRSLIESAIPDDPRAMERLSADFAELGRLACRATVARCERCPLRGLLPEGGPLGDA